VTAKKGLGHKRKKKGKKTKRRRGCGAVAVSVTSSWTSLYQDGLRKQSARGGVFGGGGWKMCVDGMSGPGEGGLIGQVRKRGLVFKKSGENRKGKKERGG